MDFAQAKQAIAGFQRFFRALSTLDEVLDAAIEAKNQSNKSAQDIINAQEELKSITNKIADLQPKLTTIKDQYDGMMTEMSEKVAAKEGALLNKLNKQIAAAKEELATVESDLSEAARTYEETLAEYGKKMKAARDETDSWEKKLAEAKAAFEKFKQGL